jgi:hypothetical protein
MPPCERDHADGSREDLLGVTTSLSAPPNFIVFSRLAGEYRSAKVLGLGNFGELMTPFEPAQLLRIAFAAWSRRKCGFVAISAREAEAASCRRMCRFSD